MRPVPHLSLWLTLAGVASFVAPGCAQTRETPESRGATPPSQVRPTAPEDVIPLVRIEPRYPGAALAQRQQGYVVVEFAVTELGSVDAPRVVEAKPRGVFDRSALEAVRKWKYSPKIVDGKAARRERVQVRLDYRLGPR